MCSLLMCPSKKERRAAGAIQGHGSHGIGRERKVGKAERATGSKRGPSGRAAGMQGDGEGLFIEVGRAKLQVSDA